MSTDIGCSDRAQPDSEFIVSRRIIAFEIYAIRRDDGHLGVQRIVEPLVEPGQLHHGVHAHVHFFHVLGLDHGGDGERGRARNNVHHHLARADHAAHRELGEVEDVAVDR